MMAPSSAGTTPAAKDTPFTTAHAAAAAVVPGLIEDFRAGFGLTRCAAAPAVMALPSANVCTAGAGRDFFSCGFFSGPAGVVPTVAADGPVGGVAAVPPLA